MATVPHLEHASLLPQPRTTLVGREHERIVARALLIDGNVPLLTLTGPGGVGKTQLALAIARDLSSGFPDGLVFVDLTPIRDSSFVLSAIAQSLGVVRSGASSLAAMIVAKVRHKQLLLICDNFEQVLDIAPSLLDVLSACPALQIIATSRAPLGIRGEHVLPVMPLAVPKADVLPGSGDGEKWDALSLFVQCARIADSTFSLTDSNFKSVSEICRRTDGLPLAIELAAGRMRLMSPDALLECQENRLRLLFDSSRDRSDRHRTMSDTVAWSYDLLTPDAQLCFRRIAVFEGNFNLEAAEEVVGFGSDQLRGLFESLQNQSLLNCLEQEGSPQRFGMLETVREFGLAVLAKMDNDSRIRDQHASYYLDKLDQSAAMLVPYLPDGGEVLG